MKATSFLVSAVQAVDGGVMVWGTSCHTLNWASFKCHSDTVLGPILLTMSNSVSIFWWLLSPWWRSMSQNSANYVTVLKYLLYSPNLCVMLPSKYSNIQSLWYFQQLDNSMTLWIKALYQTKWQVSEIWWKWWCMLDQPSKEIPEIWFCSRFSVGGMFHPDQKISFRDQNCLFVCCCFFYTTL